jgi:hypothetical protein
MNKTPITVYVSGKITGVKDLNKPKFNAAAVLLKRYLTDGLYRHVVVINPHCLPDNHDKSWGAYMRECLVALCKCERTYVLDDWKKSKGALTEVLVSKIIGVELYEVETMGRLKCSYGEIMARLLVKLVK